MTTVDGASEILGLGRLYKLVSTTVQYHKLRCTVLTVLQDLPGHAERVQGDEREYHGRHHTQWGAGRDTHSGIRKLVLKHDY